MRVTIAGAGRGGLAVASHLQNNGLNVIVIERDPLVAKRVFEQFGIVALVGDATDPVLLGQAEAARADAVLAMLHRDADNLAVVMLAKSLGARRVMVRMREPEYRSVYVAAGVNQILSETEVLVGALATAVEHETVRHSMLVGNGSSIAFEVEIPEEAWIIGKSVSEVAADKAFPPSCVIAGLTRNGAVEAARGNSTFTANTQLLVISATKELNAAISFFQAPASRKSHM